MSAPASGQTSTTQYTASLTGGYIIDCFAQPEDAAEPFCDNSGNWLCNRDATCYANPVNKLTVCTGAGTFSCGNCRSGYQTCDGNAADCEVLTNSTNYPTGANNHYIAACGVECDTNYLDCDGEGADATDGCEILNGGTCASHAVYNGCSAGNGVCQCSSGYNDCNSDLALLGAGNGCEIHTGDACTTGQGVSGTYSACTCVPSKSYFETGTQSVYSTDDPLLWGQQVGTGQLMNFWNADEEIFSLTGSGAMTLSGVDSSLSTSGAILTEDNLTLNGDNGAVDAVLTFGNASGVQTLEFLNTAQMFQFSTDVNVQGNLTVSGTINGVDISNLASDATHLKVSSGAGLTISVAAGDYRINGTLIRYDGGSNIVVQPSTTNYIFMTATGANVGATFPTDRSFIPLATVVTSEAGVTTVTDRRSMNVDDREQSEYIDFNPTFEGASYLGDGTSNVGRLFVTDEDGVTTNYYKWTSTISTLQDYDITLRTTVPYSFLSWRDSAMQLRYKTDTADTADNAFTVSVYDTADAAVTLSGSVANIASSDWTTKYVEFTDGTWTEGETFRMVFHMMAKDNHFIDLGSIRLWLKKLIDG